MRAYFYVLEVAVSANRCSIIQGCRICNKMEEDGNSSYSPTPLNASITCYRHVAKKQVQIQTQHFSTKTSCNILNVVENYGVPLLMLKKYQYQFAYEAV